MKETAREKEKIWQGSIKSGGSTRKSVQEKKNMNHSKQFVASILQKKKNGSLCDNLNILKTLLSETTTYDKGSLRMAS